VTNRRVVAAALARLANGTASGRTNQASVIEPDSAGPPAPEAVVSDAEQALASLRTAAAFVGDDGEARVAAAVTAADQAGDTAVAERGRAVRAALDRFRTAANGSDSSQPAGNRADDHFHSGRATLLTGDGVASE